MQKILLELGRLSDLAARSCRYAAVMAVTVLISLAPMALAVEMPSLYTVEVPFEPSEPDAQSTAFRAALTEVLIRVTGTTAVVESEEIAALFPNPRRFVSQFRPGQDETLVVTLEGEAIERVLRQAGAPVWGTDRPLTLVWLAVDWGMGEREIVGADDADRLPGDARSIDRNKLLRERVQEVAGRRGIPVAFPLLDIEDLTNVSFSDIWGGFDERLLSASARYETTSVLVGRIRPEDMEVDRWTWFFGANGRLDWGGEPEDAVGILADALAAEFAIDPNQGIDTIHLTISGIDSVVAYGRVQRFMENLRVVDKLMIKTVAGDRITYEVEVQGGVERLDGALVSSGMLESVESTGVIDTSSYRLDGGPFGTELRRPGEPSTLEYLYRSLDN
jgi:hypothetical protein